MDGERGGASWCQGWCKAQGGTNPLGLLDHAGLSMDLVNGGCVPEGLAERWGSRCGGSCSSRGLNRVCGKSSSVHSPVAGCVCSSGGSARTPSGEHLELNRRPFPSISSSHPAELKGEIILIGPGKIVLLACKCSRGPAFTSQTPPLVPRWFCSPGCLLGALFVVPDLCVGPR